MSKDDAQRTFDRWAGSYERDPFSRSIARLQRDALEALELHEGDRLLDVGCGTGAAVRTAAEVAQRAVGVDLSPRMLAEARERARGVPNVEFVQGDSENLPFGEGEFTAVLCTTSLHHYPHPDAAAQEFARVLAPGGRVVLGDGTSDSVVMKIADFVCRKVEKGHVRFHKVEELRALLAEAGLEQADGRSRWGGTYGIVTARKAAQPAPAAVSASSQSA